MELTGYPVIGQPGSRPANFNMTLKFEVIQDIRYPDYFVPMGLPLDGTSEHVAHARRRIGIFGEKNPICD